MLRASLVAYNNGPLNTIRIVETYGGYGRDHSIHYDFRQGLLTDLIAALGEPVRKTRRRGREAIHFETAGGSLSAWHSDHTYVELK